ncbi:SAM-dependent methyltransferase [Saccharopolyspora gloriosae]|uniref:SAM-dependent methyltransferase n=1 Tax=Saccharopolyspora gloriosae TaxID=455344 RepID=UPI001FB6C27A|nr:SAM-dependent methyltransferase [Saccharopolyspora gloriosae]
MTEPEHQEFAPIELDLSRPSVARVYDYYLGGEANWEIDRQFAASVVDEFPSLPRIARANRLFLHRVVRHLTRLGVRQFVDIGSGLPTMGHAHQIAEQIDSSARVVYVDCDPVAVAHSRLLLDRAEDPNRHAVIDADLRDPDRLWQRVLGTNVIDEREPVACLLIAVLHLQQTNDRGDELGPAAVARLRELLPSRSYLAISHVTDDGVPEHIRSSLTELEYRYRQAGHPIYLRTRDEIECFLGEYAPISPGLCWTPRWHPEETQATRHELDAFDNAAESAIWAGVGHKPM